MGFALVCRCSGESLEQCEDLLDCAADGSERQRIPIEPRALVSGGGEEGGRGEGGRGRGGREGGGEGGEDAAWTGCDRRLHAWRESNAWLRSTRALSGEDICYSAVQTIPTAKMQNPSFDFIKHHCRTLLAPREGHRLAFMRLVDLPLRCLGKICKSLGKICKHRIANYLAKQTWPSEVAAAELFRRSKESVDINKVPFTSDPDVHPCPDRLDDDGNSYQLDPLRIPRTTVSTARESPGGAALTQAMLSILPLGLADELSRRMLELEFGIGPVEAKSFETLKFALTRYIAD